MSHDLTDVAMLVTDTTRSRAYLQNMARRDLRPTRIVVLSNTAQSLPGQSRAPVVGQPDHVADDPLWQQGHFDPNAGLMDAIAALNVPCETIETADINDPAVVAAIAALDCDTLIYSGYGGQILRGPVLSAGPRFLHVHGGWVPSFKGSTTNYYSLITEDSLAASAIFLTADLDGGPVLARRRFPAPPDRGKLDHLHDSAARAVVLCDVLDTYAASGEWPSEIPDHDEADSTYFVIHPVLKHIAVYGGHE